MLIKSRSKRYNTKFLTPSDRLESLYDRNYKQSEDKDGKIQAEAEEVYKESKE